MERMLDLFVRQYFFFREPLIKKEAELVQVENTEKRLVNSAVQTRRYKHRPHDTENLLNHDNL